MILRKLKRCCVFFILYKKLKKKKYKRLFTHRKLLGQLCPPSSPSSWLLSMVPKKKQNTHYNHVYRKTLIWKRIKHLMKKKSAYIQVQGGGSRVLYVRRHVYITHENFRRSFFKLCVSGGGQR